MRIVETFTPKKIRSTAGDYFRFSCPRAGDLVRYFNADNQEKYAVVERMPENGFVTIVKGFMDPFMGDDYLSISGGPFERVAYERLEPTMATKPVRFWHWGDNGAGGGMACHFYLDRPVFDLK